MSDPLPPAAPPSPPAASPPSPPAAAPRKPWWQDSENIKLAVSLGALCISAISVSMSVYVFHAQFKLDMRPFVGMVRVERIGTQDELVLDATLKNVGKLPASDVVIACHWVIGQPGKTGGTFTHEEAPKTVLIFPTEEVKFALPLHGRFRELLDDPAYEINVSYVISYHALNLDEHWTSTYQIHYNRQTGVAIQSASAN